MRKVAMMASRRAKQAAKDRASLAVEGAAGCRTAREGPLGGKAATKEATSPEAATVAAASHPCPTQSWRTISVGPTTRESAVSHGGNGPLRLHHKCNLMVKDASGKSELCMKLHARPDHKYAVRSGPQGPQA